MPIFAAAVWTLLNVVERGSPRGDGERHGIVPELGRSIALVLRDYALVAFAASLALAIVVSRGLSATQANRWHDAASAIIEKSRAASVLLGIFLFVVTALLIVAGERGKLRRFDLSMFANWSRRTLTRALIASWTVVFVIASVGVGGASIDAMVSAHWSPQEHVAYSDPVRGVPTTKPAVVRLTPRPSGTPAWALRIKPVNPLGNTTSPSSPRKQRPVARRYRELGRRFVEQLQHDFVTFKNRATASLDLPVRNAKVADKARTTLAERAAAEFALIGGDDPRFAGAAQSLVATPARPAESVPDRELSPAGGRGTTSLLDRNDRALTRAQRAARAVSDRRYGTFVAEVFVSAFESATPEASGLSSALLTSMQEDVSADMLRSRLGPKAHEFRAACRRYFKASLETFARRRGWTPKRRLAPPKPSDVAIIRTNVNTLALKAKRMDPNTAIARAFDDLLLNPRILRDPTLQRDLYRGTRWETEAMRAAGREKFSFWRFVRRIPIRL